MSLARVATIAQNTIREAIRNKVMYTLVFFGVLLVVTGIVVSSLSYVEAERILQSVSLSAIRIFGAAIAIFMGVSLIHREVDRRTVYAVLAKPVARAEFLVGKYLGLVATLWMQTAIMALAFVGVSLLSEAPLDAGHAAAIGLASVEFAVLVAVATFFSSFTTPMLSSLFSAGIYVIGHGTRDIVELSVASKSELVQTAANLLHRVVPDLEGFNLTIPAIHQLPIESAQVLAPLAYGLFYIVALLALASFVFERRDLR